MTELIPSEKIEIFHNIKGEKSQAGESGACGTVVKGQWNGKVVAIKSMHKVSVNAFGESGEKLNEKYKRELMNEAENFSKLNHPRIIKFYGMTIFENCVHIVIEFVEGGSLHELIDRTIKKTEILEALTKIQIGLDVAVGVNYLHTEHNMVHRDLKPRNILICGGGSSEGAYRAKLCDFGLARNIFLKTLQNVGTALYAAPEVFNEGDIEKMGNYSVDVYSFGVTLWCLFFESKPPGMREKFPSDSHPKVACGEETAEKIIGIVRSCCRVDPEKRANMKEVVGRLEGVMDELKMREYSKVMELLEKKKGESAQREAVLTLRIGELEEEVTILKSELQMKEKELFDLSVKMERRKETITREKKEMNDRERELDAREKEMNDREAEFDMNIELFNEHTEKIVKREQKLKRDIATFSIRQKKMILKEMELDDDIERFNNAINKRKKKEKEKEKMSSKKKKKKKSRNISTSGGSVVTDNTHNRNAFRNHSFLTSCTLVLRSSGSVFVDGINSNGKIKCDNPGRCNKCKIFKEVCKMEATSRKYVGLCEELKLCRDSSDTPSGFGNIHEFVVNFFKIFEPVNIFDSHTDLIEACKLNVEQSKRCETPHCKFKSNSSSVMSSFSPGGSYYIKCTLNEGSLNRQILHEFNNSQRESTCNSCFLRKNLKDTVVIEVTVCDKLPTTIFVLAPTGAVANVEERVVICEQPYELRGAVLNNGGQAWAHVKVFFEEGSKERIWVMADDMSRKESSLSELNNEIRDENTKASFFCFVKCEKGSKKLSPKSSKLKKEKGGEGRVRGKKSILSFLKNSKLGKKK